MKSILAFSYAALLLVATSLPSFSLDRNGYYQEWQKLSQAHEFNKAVTLLNKAVADYPQEAMFEILLAYSYQMLGHPETAFPHYQTALRLNPKDQQVLDNVYSGYISYAWYLGTSQHSWENCSQWLVKAEALEPGKADAYNIQGMALCNAGKTEDALVAFETAFAKDPSSVNGPLKANFHAGLESGIERAKDLKDPSYLVRYCNLALNAYPKDEPLSGKAFLALWGSPNLDLLVSMLKAGAKTSSRDSQNLTPLMWAAKNWKPEAIVVLLGAGADANLTSREGKTALDFAADNTQAKGTYAYTAMQKCTAGPFHAPAFQGFLRLIQLLQTGTGEQIRTAMPAQAEINDTDENGMTPLMVAAKYNSDPSVTTDLLNAGAKLDAQDDYQRTALMWAAEWSQNPGVVATLLAAGANANLSSTDGRTALDYAAANRELNATDAQAALAKATESGARRLDAAKIETIDTGITIAGPQNNTFGYPHITTAPMTALDDGGYAVIYSLPGGTSHVAFYSNDDKIEKVVDITDKGMPAGIASWKDMIAFLYKIGKNRLDFRVLNEPEKTVVIMDNGERTADGRGLRNSGKGLVFWDHGSIVFGTEAMFDPITLGRGNLLFAFEAWVASFTYGNNFAASGKKVGEFQLGKQNSHWGEIVLGFPAEGRADTKLISAWGVSHSMDLRTVYDGEYLAHISIGDVYPADFKFAVFGRDGEKISTTELFAKNAFPDALMGKDKHGKKLYGVAGGPGEVSAKLGELLPIARGEFLFTYRIKPGKYNNSYLSVDNVLTTKIDELGVMRLDRDGHVLFRKKLLPGMDVEFVKTIRYGDNYVLAWKVTNQAVYKMMVIEANGTIVDEPTVLPHDVFFNAADPFVQLKDGDIVWTAAGEGNSYKAGEMKIFRMRLDRPAS